MIGAIERMHWLHRRDHADLLVHALCGAWLSPPDYSKTWFAPARVSRGDRVFLLCYEAPQATFGLCALLPREIDADWVSALRKQLSPHGAETKWRYFAALCGPYRHAGTGAPIVWSMSTIAKDGELWRVRRAHHPAALIDRLLARDRKAAEAHLRAALGGQSDDLDIDSVPSPEKARYGS